ncbi:MAG: DNA mismatch repair protein MutS [Treponemataceae bacterium]|nr:DNA mismatch repair protein MutS [Treponemataceae bacterium]
MEPEENLTPVMVQYLKIKGEHKNEVLFFRLGDFYEMFNEDAVEVSRLLNLTLTHRGQAPMCGIPHHAAKIYIARLLRLGKKIVVCEQVGDPKGKGLTERKVVEVITPGTAVEAEYLEGGVNSFLAALCVSRGMAGFAFIDVTTSAFSATSWRASEMAGNFSRELGRCSPRELLLPQSLRGNAAVQQAVSEIPGLSVSYYPDWDFNAELSFRRLSEQFKTATLHPFGLDEDSPEVPPAGFLLDYLLKTTNTAVPHVSGIRVYRDSQFLMIDDSSRRNLEIVSNLRDGGQRYTLLECVNHARTSMGSRLIRQWLLYPLTDVGKITARQNHVALFFGNRSLSERVREELSSVLDIERLAGRIAMDRAHPKDLQALRGSLASWLSAREALSAYDFASLDERPVQEVIELIGSAIADDPAVALTDGGIIRAGWSEELDRLREVHDNFDKILCEYEQEERARTGISTLKIKCTNAAGYFIEVSKGKLSAVPENFILRRALVNGDRYTTARLQELAQELSEAGSRILELERDLFLEVRARLHEFVPHLMQAAGEIAYTDAAASFAEAARLYDWIRPSVSEDGILSISAGRHPVVEKHLPHGEFVPNDIQMRAHSREEPFFALITGPNMAGKSTFLRQNALIVLLAQAGSFVPAAAAEIGIADRIFCRVGASDNLARGESTFLVEMTETANILRSATDKSLVIMDEVGRGTSTEDGLSIAQAVSEYLLNVICCRTLFATHYHELTRIENPQLRLLCMDVSEQAGTITFLRKVREGATENSYGIHVARLAGVPQEVIDRANVILEHIQDRAETRPVLEALPDYGRAPGGAKELCAPGLFSDEEIILDEILSSDPDSMTPLSALQAVARWKKALSGR